MFDFVEVRGIAYFFKKKGIGPYTSLTMNQIINGDKDLADDQLTRTNLVIIL
jgi:hypothetical protein